MKYSIVIPTYNHCYDLLKPCVDSILKYSSIQDLELIIISNGSTDETESYLQSLKEYFMKCGFPNNIKYKCFKEALGYTKATNIGIKVATCNYIVLLNNDIELTEQNQNEWLTLLESHFKNPIIGIAGHSVGWHYELNVLGALFYCVMIKKEVFYRIGLLDEIYSPGGMEDHDFCHRAILAGYQLASVDFPNKPFPLIHKENQTFKDLPCNYQRVLKRNNEIFKKKFSNSKKYSIVIPTYDHCNDLLKPCIDSIIKYSSLEEIELVIISNGSIDETEDYLKYMKRFFALKGLESNFKYEIHEEPLGYAKATNAGIRLSTCQKIVLLNNDVVLLEQHQNRWLQQLENCFVRDPKCGIGCLVKSFSPPAGREFAIFFCVMIDRKVFDTIGLLSEDYGIGAGEDTEFSIEAVNAGFTIVEAVEKKPSNEGFYTGDFPLYHKGEGTVHDENLVSNWNKVFHKNSLTLARKYNKDNYRFLLSNNLERAVFLKGDPVLPQFTREHARYTWAAENILGKKVLEIGCSTGYGSQYFPQDLDYTGLDYDPIIIDCAKEQNWGKDFKFINADINKFEFEQYDTIIAFEVIEHIPNGLEIVQMLKKHCRRLLITVPRKEPPGYWGPHHVLHNLHEEMFPGFKFKYITGDGSITDQPDESQINLMVCRWDNE